MKRNLLSTVLLFCVSLFLPHTLFAQDESKVETYNFQSFISSCTTGHGLVLGGASGISVNGSELTYVADFTKENYNTLRDVSLEFSTNGRFAVYGGFGFHRNRYDTYRVRATGDGRIFSILNLNAGDKVSLITNAGTGGEPATGIAFLSDNAKLEGEENNVSVGDLLQSGVTYVITDGQNHLDLSLSSNNGFQQIVITPNPNVEVVSTPSINVVGAYDGQRTIEIVSGASSIDDNSVKSYYTLNGEVPSSSSNEYVSPFTIEETTTIRVISISSSGKASMVLAHEVEAGTVLQLAAPEVGLVGMELAPTGSLYNPKYGFTADNSSVIGNPESSFTCSFVSVAGDVINVGKATDFVFSVPGTLTVTASADGYADSKTDFTVDVVNYSVMKEFDIAGTSEESIIANGWGEMSDASWGGTPRVSRYGGNSSATIEGLTFAGLDKFYWYVGYGLYNGNGGGRAVTVTDAYDGEFAVYEYYHNNIQTIERTVAYLNGGQYVWDMPRYDYLLYNIKVFAPAKKIGVNITGAKGLATFTPSVALDFTDAQDIAAYTATVSGTTVNLTRTNTVAAGEGVLIRSLNGDHVSEDIPVAATAVEPTAGNMFVGVLEDIAQLSTENGGYTNFILNNNGDNGSGFYLANNKTVAAGKAYLRVPTESAAKISFFSLDGSITGIEGVEAEAAEGEKVYYNLKGQRVATPSKGLYIVGGKKVIVK